MANPARGRRGMGRLLVLIDWAIGCERHNRPTPAVWPKRLQSQDYNPISRHGKYSANGSFQSSVIVPEWTRWPLASSASPASSRMVDQPRAHAFLPQPAHRPGGRTGRVALRRQARRRCGGRRVCRSHFQHCGDALVRRSRSALDSRWHEVA